MKHASFFSGVGGLDLGFERAGIETVSVSEIDPYANAVLAERFPDAPNLGDIVKLAERELGGSNEQGYLADKNDWRLQRPLPASGAGWTANAGSESNVGQADGGRSDWRTADIWSGGFPCQDLSVAGKRAGFAGKRSSLAFTFLDLVEQRRPRWLVLENVPGLFSSNNGADFGRLLYEMEQLGYGVSWRTLDARHFGVAQRRRRVFIVASLESDRAGEVLLECEGCERHPSPRTQKGQGVASGAGHSTGGNRDGEPAGRDSSPDSDRMRALDGMARRLDNQPILSFPSRFGSNANVTEDQAQSMAHSAGAPAVLLATEGGTEDEDDLLPVGLDSHRYRCCGNGVVAPVAEWIGRRIVEVDRRWREEGK